MEITFYLKASVLQMTFYICVQQSKKKNKNNPPQPHYCIYLFTFPKLTHEVLDSRLPHEDMDLESTVQGNPSKEETDFTLSDLEYHYANRKTFSKGKISNGLGRNFFFFLVTVISSEKENLLFKEK